ncbi:MAG TPA: alpha/beta hydrolase-fold protein, partial [Gemmatimonadaceae bacterium]|nr:alpha/beta hydrolase-fold protein [Gemmatimonadaceae bacterium]
MTIRNPARPRLRRPPSWAVPVLAALLLAAPLAAPLAAQSSAAAGACTSTATGDLRTHRLESRLFGNTRTIRVLLPDDYGAPQNATRRYPVLYLLDGQNLFDACLSE